MRLIDRLLSGELGSELEGLAVETLCAYATEEDVEAITEHLCASPSSKLGLDVMLRRGSRQQARRLWDVWKRFEVPEGGLTLLGRFGIQEALTVSWCAVCSNDHYQQFDGVLGLLGLELEELREEIVARLDREEGRPLFPEALPALAAAAGWPDALSRLRLWRDQASTDCLGGILLGVALVGGRQARETLVEMLEQERYELGYGGTGNVFWSWIAGRLLGLDLSWLASELRVRPVSETLGQIFLGWTRQRLRWRADPLRQLPEPIALEKLYTLAFGWGPDPNMDGSLVPHFPQQLRDDYYATRQLTSLAVSREWLGARL